MKDVYIDAMVSFEFCLPATSAQLFCVVFFILWTAVDLLQDYFCLPVLFLTFIRAISSIIFSTFELNESRRRSTESAEILGVKDIAFINNALVFSLMHLFLRSRFSGDRDQYIKENTEVIRKCYILNNNGWHV